MDEDNVVLIKFLTFLQEYKERAIRNFKKKITSSSVFMIDGQMKALEKKIVIIDNFIKLFSIPKEEWKNYRILCKDFDILSDLLLESPLDKRECTAIIFLLVEKNIRGKIFDNSSIIIDYETIKKHKFKTLTKKELEEEVTIYQLLMGDQSMTPNWTQEQYAEFYEFAKKHIVDISNVQRYHKDIQEHYFDKIATYQKEDVKVILEALLNLGVNKELVLRIKSTLLKGMNKHLIKNNFDTVKERSSKLSHKVKIDASNYRFKNEYSWVLNQLEEFVDLRELLPKCFLNREQTLDVVGLMLKVGIERANIQTFLKNLEVENNIRKINPIVKYLDLYDKLKYYETRLVLIEELKTLEDYFKMLCIADDSEYSFWKGCLKDTLDDYLKVIPGSFEYEFEEGAKRLRKEKH